MKKTTIVLYMNDDVECGRFDNIKDAYHALLDIKEVDKKEFIKGNEYYFEVEVETETQCVNYRINIYKYKNKIKWKYIK